VRTKTLEIKNNFESQDEERGVSSKKVMELLCNVVDEIKKDLEQERKSHQQNKSKLLGLFSSASEKLHFQ